jgi:hypothetical protein
MIEVEHRFFSADELEDFPRIALNYLQRVDTPFFGILSPVKLGCSSRKIRCGGSLAPSGESLNSAPTPNTEAPENWLNVGATDESN